MEDYKEVYNQGHTLYKQGAYQEALTYFEQAIEMNSEFMFAHYLKGLSHINLNNWPEVVTTFKRVIELAPQEGDAYLNIGTALYYQKQYDEAIEYMEKAIEVGLQDNPLERAYYNLGLAYKDRALTTDKGGFLGKWDGALTAFNKCLKENPKYVVAHFQLGIILLTMKCYEDAIKAFEQNISYDVEIKHSTTMQSVVGLANCYCALYDFEKTLHYLKQAIDVEPRVKGVAQVDVAFNNIRESEYAEQFNALVG
ncbi:MAG: tetratricopeptide repeat protein [Aureispira sp.]|nr:tetratricopeptide repeat protein [Aureispira sp.]